MVLAMHAGFAFLELGTVRKKKISGPCTACAVHGVLLLTAGIRLTQEEEFEGADLTLHRIGSTPVTAPEGSD